MANDYFTASTYSVTAGTRARASDLNNMGQGLETGLDKLPSEANIKRGLINYTAVDAGAPDAAIVTLTYAPTSYVDGMEVVFKSAETNTGGACTINVNSLGVKSIVRHDGTNPVAGDIEAGKIVVLRYNSTSGKFELQGSLGAPSGSGTMALQNANAVAITGGTIAGVSMTTTSLLNPTLTKGNDTHEGGEIVLEASASYTDGHIDIYDEDIRIFKTLATDFIVKLLNFGAGTVNFQADGDIETLAGAFKINGTNIKDVVETLTNKTLTSPVVNTSVSGTAILDEDNMASDSATQLTTQQAAKAYSDLMIKGDGTKGRVIRQIKLTIADGTNASTLKCTAISLWNGDSESETDNISKGGTTGNFYLSAGGNTLTYLNSGLTGDCVAVLAANIYDNTSGSDADLGYEVSGGAYLYFSNKGLGTMFDLTSVVDSGTIIVVITYITSA